MNKSWQRFLAFVMAVFAGSVMAGAIHTWSNGETLTSTDLNANFTHIHNLMVGGHGARLVDADVNASANISTSKIQNGGGIATSFTTVLATCVGSPCTMVNPQGFTSITRSGAGVYVATLDHTPAKTPAIAVTSVGINSACRTSNAPTNTFTISCTDMGAGPVDTGFTVVVWEHP